MAVTRFYSTTAGEMALAQPALASATSVTLDTVVGLPSQYPYTLALDHGALTEELVDVTSASGATLVIVRGRDGTFAQDHSVGAKVRHVISARDLRESREHEDKTLSVHGIVDTAELTTPTNTQTFTNKTISGASNTLTNIPLGALKVVPRTTYTPTWTVITGTDPTLGNGTITGSWSQIGSEVFTSIRLLIGSTTSAGSGIYRVSLPVPQKIGLPVVGHGVYADAGAGYLFVTVRVASPATVSVMMASLTSTGNGLTEWQSGGPVVPAAGDVLDLNLNYEAA